jgi:hypothetical protein
MKLTVEWSHVCTPDVRRMNWEAAARVCRAVLDFAEGRAVRVERARPGDPSLLRIRARGGDALVHLDAEARTVFVWRIYPTQR